MTLDSHSLKLSVTVNAYDISQWVTGGSISKTTEIATATLTLANKDGKFFNYFRGRDQILIKVGLDYLPGKYQFFGVPVSQSGGSNITLSLIGILHSCESEYIYLDEYDNYDGWEVSEAIKKQLTDMDMAGYVSKYFEGTTPQTFVPIGYRQEKGITRYDFIKFARDLAYSTVESTGETLEYVLFDDAGTLHFEKQKQMVDGNQDWTFTYGDNLITCQPETKSLGVVNRQTVFAKDGTKVTFNLSNDQQVKVSGVMEGTPNSLDYGTVEDALNRARKECLLYRTPIVNTQITSVDLIDSVPGLSYVKIVDAPNMANGLHRIVKTDIDFTGGLRVTCDLVKQQPSLGKEILSMILAGSSNITRS
jgi:hypothetical protein